MPTGYLQLRHTPMLRVFDGTFEYRGDGIAAKLFVAGSLSGEPLPQPCGFSLDECRCEGLLVSWDPHTHVAWVRHVSGVAETKPATQSVCPDCKGTRMITLFTSVEPCTRCSGGWDSRGVAVV